MGMSLRFVIDECSVANELRMAIAQSSAAYNVSVDIVWVGDDDAPDGGTLDPELLEWAYENDRAIVTNDRNTLVGIYVDFVRQTVVDDRPLPPPLFTRTVASVGEIAEWIVIGSQILGEEVYGQWIPIPLDAQRTPRRLPISAIPVIVVRNCRQRPLC